MTTSAGRPTWSPPPLIRNPWQRWAIYLGVLVYLGLALSTLEVNWLRVYEGLARGQTFVGAFLTPDFTARADDIRLGMIESLTMTVTSTLAGIGLAIPVGIGAARNIAPRAVYYGCRAFITVSRSLQEVIIAILFVAMVGFGPLAGFLTPG